MAFPVVLDPGKDGVGPQAFGCSATGYKRGLDEREFDTLGLCEGFVRSSTKNVAQTVKVVDANFCKRT